MSFVQRGTSSVPDLIFSPAIQAKLAEIHSRDLSPFERYLEGVLSGPANALANFPAFEFGACVAVLIAAVILGRRLSRVSKPDAPLLSPLLQGLGLGLFWGAMLTAGMALLAGVAFVTGFWLIQKLDLFSIFFDGHIRAASVGGALGLSFMLPITMRVIPLWERKNGGLPDVSELVDDFAEFNKFNPEPYFKTKSGCFVGLTADRQPLYLPWQKLRETHVQIIGTTGSGKGVLLTAIAAQAILAEEGLVFFGPKLDRFAPRILKRVAETAGKPFVLLDLSIGAPPQLSLLAGATQEEIIDLLVAGFDLRAKGSDGDFHRGRDEDAAVEAAAIAAAHGIGSITELIHACAGVEEITNQENFWRCLKKISRVTAIDTAVGINLVDILDQGGVIYVIGSCDSEPVKMVQKMVLARVVQIIKNRSEKASEKLVCVVLDELKHMLSIPVLTALAVVRSFGAHFLLAHQSLGDLDSCPGISPEEVRGAVIDNTSIKFVYRINDGEFAEWLSKAAGRKRTFVEGTNKDVNEDTSSGGWQEKHIEYLNPDLLTHLPLPSDRPKQASTGVLIGWRNAKLFHIGPMEATGDMPTPTAAKPCVKPSCVGPI